MIIGFYTLPHKNRWLWLLLGSYFFYMVHEPSLALLLIISTTVDYFCALKMPNASYRIKKYLLCTSIFTNIGILFSFKYLFFFTSSIEGIFKFFGLNIIDTSHTGAYNFNQILLPVGISFYTFQTLSYTIDVYRGKISPEKHFGVFALYVSFFPQLVAGPIERASRLIPQLKKEISIHLPNLKKGLIMIAWGFFLKVVVADRLGVYVDAAFEDPEFNHGLPLFIGSFFFAFQIYYDFSAYTSIAIGTAKTMGFDLIQNFNKPYFATSISEFWKRWHISLMDWLKDYIFIPLGGSRCSKLKVVRNVLILFFIVGLWHGANWTFVIWGILNAVLLIIEFSTNGIRKLIFKTLKVPKTIIKILGWCSLAICLSIPLIFFRSPSITDAFLYFKSMFNITGLHVNILNNYFELILNFIFIIGIQTIHYFKGNDKIHELVLNKSTAVRWSIYLSYILVIVLFAINRQNTFIYFQF
ncbi:MBOAT family O-acyltransferase [Flavivirga abyssicola]|uniref:MBOAT family O-acyltransferase n=1 Tax=Flavivirga abyssicola TaxID=3063533 RepID=UPI0026E07E81|nr:MBOAT family O-acyltransferase [Flavivirga sp. MEBiC07777]WVK12995.1 MBOAT family O-acyltransferase [Flavivirga sp. MEBiC07777]